MKKMTTEEVKKRIIEQFGDKFDLSKIEYIDNRIPITIICPEHGEFRPSPGNLWKSPCGCPSCSKSNRITSHTMTTERFIREAKNKHNDKYSYEKTIYTGQKNKVIITCPEHGEFKQKPYHHLAGHGCPACVGLKPYTTETFIERSRQIHNNRYDYSKVKYINNFTKICIICPEHGEFWQVPNSHLSGKGCIKCSPNYKDTTQSFIEKALKKHGTKYDYSKVLYKNSKTRVCIICSEHGEFWQDPDKHIQGHGCPICNESHLERDIRLYLKEHNIVYIPQDDLNDLLGKQSVDFYLPDYNLAIECQGKQHFGTGGWKKTFDALYYSDIKKSKILKENNINLVYYTTENKDLVFNHETGLYNENNTYFDLSFLDKLLNKKDIVGEISKEIKNHFKNLEIEENKKIGNTIVTLFFSQFNTGINITDVNIGTEWKYGFERYHRLEQTNECIANGISLIQLFSDEWFQNKELILKKISHILGLNMDKPSVMGRKCKIRGISKSAAFLFLDKNHVQGSVSATVYLGAFYNNELVAVMTFRKEGGNKWDLNRFASDNDYRCIGIGGKLFKYFIKNFNPVEIKSFADKRWTIKYDNNLYTNLGFQVAEHTKPEYRYVNADTDPNIRHHKFGFRKERLNAKYGLSIEMTESEMTKKIGYDRIWDCGLIKYIWLKS